MLKWLKDKAVKLLGQAAGVLPDRNDAGLPDELVVLLFRDFQALEKERPGLASRLLDYVLNGSDAGCLSTLASVDQAGRTLGLYSSDYGSVGDARDKERKRFWSAVGLTDPRFYLRLAHIYRAAMTKCRSLLGFEDLLGQAAWLEVFLCEASCCRIHCYPRRCTESALTADLIEEMLAAEDHPRDLLVRVAFLGSVRGGWACQNRIVFQQVRGFPEAAVRHTGPVKEALRHSDAQQRVHALQLISEKDIAVDAFTAEIVDAAVGAAKTVRTAATVLLPKAREAFLPLLREKIISGAAAERPFAVTLFASLAGESGEAFLRDRLAQETAPKTREALENALGAPVAAREDGSIPLDVPPLPPFDPKPALPAAAKDQLSRLFNNYNEQAQIWYAQEESRPYAPTQVPVIPESNIAAAVRLLEQLSLSNVKGASRTTPSLSIHYQYKFRDQLLKFVATVPWELIHALRFLVLTGHWREDPSRDRLWLGWLVEPTLTALRRRKTFDLRVLAQAFEALAGRGDLIGRQRMLWYGSYFHWEPDAVWPYFAEHLHLLEEALDLRASEGRVASYEKTGQRRHAYDILQMFPRLPPSLIPRIWEAALSGPKTERLAAQQCLETVPDRDAHLLAALRDGRQEVRAEVAAWAGRLRLQGAAPLLQEALAREKSALAASAQVCALESLGIPLGAIIDRDGLRSEADKGLKKPIPADLAWFPFDALPPVHWQDTGNQVERAVLRWMLVKTCRLRNPEPDPLLRGFCALLRAADRERFGDCILGAWIQEDVRVLHTPAELETLARQSVTQHGQHTQLTPDQLFKMYYEMHENANRNSAVGSKGILALVAACSTHDTARGVERYLKTWYGMRAAQCKALIRMLAWVEHPTAAQCLLAVASRFRTRGIQEEAMECAKALAERRGWTLDEFADRTIPAAGMDDEGVLALDYGTRRFTARLGKDLKFALRNQDNEPVKNLPEPGKTDDAEKAAEARKLFSQAKKDVESVLKTQRLRLYEALCTQRSWSLAEWQTYLLRHPIVRHFCARLVWCLFDGEDCAGSFRPLEDGSMTGPVDDTVVPSESAKIRLAHATLLADNVGAAWQQHFADYEVEPLFEQFGKKKLVLSQELGESLAITEYRGFVTDAFKLRNRATRNGYTRGQAEDGGWFSTYHKRFPALELDAVIRFTGNSLPEENRAVALDNLHFRRLGEHAARSVFGDEGDLLLKDLPMVLLSECWNDLQQIAEEGSGFDPDWEKKTQL